METPGKPVGPESSNEDLEPAAETSPETVLPVAPRVAESASEVAGRRGAVLDWLYRKFRPIAAAGALLAAELPNAAQAEEPADGKPRQEQMTMAERHAQLAEWAAPLGVDGLSFARGPWRSLSENVTVLVGGKNIGDVKAKGLEMTETELLAGLADVFQKAGVTYRADAAELARAEMAAARAAEAAVAAAEAEAAKAKGDADRAAAIADARARGEKPVEQMTMAERHAQLAEWAAPLGVDGLSFARGPWSTLCENVTVLVEGKSIGDVTAAGISFEKEELLGKLSGLLTKEGVKHELPTLNPETNSPENVEMTESLESLGVTGLEVRDPVLPVPEGSEAKGVYINGEHVGDVVGRTGKKLDRNSLMFRVVKLLQDANIPFK